MKKIASILFLSALIACLASGCASVSSMKALAGTPRIAIVSVGSNGDIGWQGDEDSGGGLVSGLGNLASNSGTKVNSETAALLSRADTLIDEAEAAFTAAMGRVRSTAILPKAAVLGSKAYAAAQEQELLGLARLKPAGYRFVNGMDKKLASALKAETGADGIMSADFTFEKAMKTGIGKNGSMRAGVTLTISVLSASGKRVLGKTYYSASKKELPVLAGIYDPAALGQAFSEAIGLACAKCVDDLDR
jgi:hypothetical protein